MKSKRYTVFENDKKPYNLNIVGVRTMENVVNTFNDWIYLFWKYKGQWSSLGFECTTDPGLYWLKTPGNPLGAAILKEGQYRGMWELGKHQGKYDALVQRGACTVIRDYDRDEFLDYDSKREETGLFGINHHRANSKKESVQVNKWSAGCVVTANPFDFNIEMAIFKAARDNFGNKFSFTLLNEKDIL